MREALIVAADAYEDPKLRRLRAPARDAEELARVLADPEIGDFRVHVSLNEPDHVVRRRLSEFFRNRGRDDLLLLHVSGHGLKDEDGTLYFATSNTEVDHLEATAVPSEFVNRQMARSVSRRVVLLLDCCFGGAFARGFVARAGDAVEVGEKFDGRGRVVLTASRAMEYAFEGDQLEGEAHPSVFTSAIVEGLETGKADRDGDSRISVDELYEYVYDQVREATPSQTPSKWTFDVEGELFVARSKYQPVVEPADLPLELRAAIESPFANVRAGAVEELAMLLGGSHAGLAAGARDALAQLLDDDSRRVSAAASAALGEGAAEPVVAAPSTVAPPPPRPAPTKSEARRRASAVPPLALVAVRARRLATPLALAGAALIVAAYFWPGDSQWAAARASWTSWDNDSWLFWSPVEALGIAGVIAAGSLAAVGRSSWRDAPYDGFRLAVGVLTLVAAVALLRAWWVGPSARVTALAALALVASALPGMLTRRADEVPRDLGAVLATGVGVALIVASLYFGEHPLVDWEGAPYTELAAGAVLAGLCAVALLRFPRLRVYAAGILVAVGIQLALHWVGSLLFLDHHAELFKLRAAIPTGLAGTGLLVASGLRVLWVARREAVAGGGSPEAPPAATV